MEAIKIWFKRFVKNINFGIISMSSSLGFFLTIKEFFSGLIGDFGKEYLGNHRIYRLIFGISLFIGFGKMFPPKTFSYKINGKDIRLGLKVGNILESNNIIIPINNHFNALQPCIMESKSVLHSIIDKYYDKNPLNLQKELNHHINKKNKYEFGKSIKIINKKFGKTFFFVANTNLGDGNQSTSKKEDFFLTISNLFQRINCDSNQSISIPLLNSSHGRISDISRIDIIQYIIDQFIIISNQRKFCNELIIYIYGKDVETYEIDIDSIAEDMKNCCHNCRQYKNFPFEGTPLD